MTFRVDYIRVRHEPGGWHLWVDFKGFRGAGVYAVAELRMDSAALVITSTMDCTQQVTVPVEPPQTLEESELRSWFARTLNELSWGPELDQRNQPMNPTPRRLP